MKIGLVDADLLDGGTRFPNLALMKIAGYYKRLGNDVGLIGKYDPAIERVFVSKVFTTSALPDWIDRYSQVSFGGTGFNLYGAEPLPDEIEHAFPDYSLYDSYIAQNYDKSVARRFFNEYYTDSSIGFTTRGCIRQCPFCVNRDKKRVEQWSHIREFYDPNRKYIVLLDDNVLAYPKWEDVFDELEATGKAIRYIQGMDVRLMTQRKAERLARIKYHRAVCFAFDNVADRLHVVRGLDVYRASCARKQTLAYVLVGYYKQGEEELRDALDRIDVLTRYDVDPYVMKHANFKNDPYANIFTELARWANQPRFRKTTFGEFFEVNASKKARAQAEGLTPNLRSRLMSTLRWQC